MADVWSFELSKVQPIWQPETAILTVSVQIDVSLDIDGAGAQIYGSHVASHNVAWGTDMETVSDLLIPKLQTFIAKCKKERLAMKASQYDALLTTIEAALTV